MSKLDIALYASMAVTLLLVMLGSGSIGAVLLGGAVTAVIMGLALTILKRWPVRLKHKSSLDTRG